MRVNRRARELRGLGFAFFLRQGGGKVLLHAKAPCGFCPLLKDTYSQTRISRIILIAVGHHAKHILHRALGPDITFSACHMSEAVSALAAIRKLSMALTPRCSSPCRRVMPRGIAIRSRSALLVTARSVPVLIFFPADAEKSGLGFRHAGLSRGKRLPRGIRALHGGLESLVLGGRL